MPFATRLVCLALLALLVAPAAVIAAAPVAVPAAATAPDYVWWEAETPKATNFPAGAPFGPWNPKGAEALSEGKWIGVTGDYAQPMFLEYEVKAPKDGDYHFYARKFWQHGPFRWRFDQMPWQECGKKVTLLDTVELAQFICANWVSLGDVKLKGGTHTLRIELTEPKGGAAFDCFVLTAGPFTPRGKLKPGQKWNLAPEGWFAFEPDADRFGPTAIDLRTLNEKAAGEGGFIQVKGEQFIHGRTGAPVRFWAINAGMDTVRMDNGSIDTMARHLAKLGINMVRVHGGVWKSDRIAEIDTALLDRLHYFVAALKKEGIYTSISIYFPVWLKLKAADGFDGYNDKEPFALLFFNKKFQDIYKGWWKAVLQTRNPYTNLPLAQDPAVGFAEIINEDSYLFWTFNPYNVVPGPQMEILEKIFGEWLKAKYGSVEAALAKWGSKAVKGDDPAAGRAGFMNLWDIFNSRNARAQDTAEFLTRHQTAFFTEMTAYLKKDLGFKGSVYGSNWITASETILGPLDKYSNTVCDFMDRHGYFGGPHEGPRAGYSISAGDQYNDCCALRFDPQKKDGKPSWSLPIMDVAYNGKPSTITEINWAPPNRYRADLPLLAAAYGLLQGTDGLFFFATGDAGWSQSLSKFSIHTPVAMGQFPATAVLYRKGLVKQGETVVDARLKLADLYALKGAPVVAPQNLDEFRAKDVPAGKPVETAAVGGIDPLAFLVGRVEMNLSETGGTSKVVDLSKFIDRPAKRLRSTTGELDWDFGLGLVKVNAPAAQGATGFLAKAGSIDLGDVTIAAAMDYGTVLVVALDDQPLATSRRMLLQVMSEETNYGWSAPGEGLRAIKDVGGPPLVVRKFGGSVSFKRPDAATLKVTALDFNGYKDKDAGAAAKIPLLESTMYYLIEK